LRSLFLGFSVADASLVEVLHLFDALNCPRASPLRRVAGQAEGKLAPDVRFMPLQNRED
jgi:hypothetical protein